MAIFETKVVRALAVAGAAVGTVGGAGMGAAIGAGVGLLGGLIYDQNQKAYEQGAGTLRAGARNLAPGVRRWSDCTISRVGASLAEGTGGRPKA